MNENPPIFHCQKCGACCRALGRVQLLHGEAEAAAHHLGMDIYYFTDTYTRLSPARTDLELREHPDGSCIMLTESGHCRIHDVKPKQCRDFPAGWRTEALTTVCPALKAVISEQ